MRGEVASGDNERLTLFIRSDVRSDDISDASVYTLRYLTGKAIEPENYAENSQRGSVTPSP